MKSLKHRKPYYRKKLYWKRDQLLTDRFIEMVDLAKKANQEWLLPAYAKLSGKLIPEKNTTGWTIWNKITEIEDDSLPGGTVWPHLIRDQRAFYFKEIIGFDAYQLKAWFDWSRLEQADHYVGTSEESALADKMGIVGFKEENKKDHPEKEPTN
jgi:hypothetical protein